MKFNETKYAILECLATARDYMTAKEIAIKCGLTVSGVQSTITHIQDMGYIWRNKNRQFGNHVPHYIYRHMKPKGWRVYLRFHEYKEIMKYTGVIIPLKYYRAEPPYIIDARRRYKKMIGLVV